MKYYKLVYDYENDDEYMNCDMADIGNMSEYELFNGKVIESWDKAIFKYDSSKGNQLSDYLANVYRWLIVSEDFRKSINDIVANQVQYLPVTVIDRKTNVNVGSYSVVNVITIIDALDLDNSRYDIFRLEGDTIPVFVSELVKKVIEDNGLLGFQFLEVDVI